MSFGTRLLAATPFLAVSFGAQAQEQVRVSADVSASVGYSHNPFSQLGDNGGTGLASISVTPQVELVRAHSTLTAIASAQVDQYFSRYPTTDSYSGALDYRGRPSEQVTTFVRVDLSSAVLGGYNNFALGFLDPTLGSNDGSSGAGNTGGVGVGAGGTGAINDIGLFGTRERRRSLYASGGLTAALSPRDRVSVSTFGDFARYRRFATSDYDGYGASLSYSRQVSAYTNLGLQTSLSRYDYQGFGGDSKVFSIEATGSTRLNKFWTLQGALGASFLNRASFGSANSTSLSGNLSLCRQGEQDSVCLSASRSARATGFNGSQYVTTVGSSYQRRLSQRARFGFAASYVKEGGMSSLINRPDGYLFISPSVTRQMGERLSLNASLRYRKVFGGISTQSGDYGGQFGISYHFGKFR